MESMLDLSGSGVPFHPAVIHLPLGIAGILPVLALLATVGIWRKWLPGRAWWLIVGLQALMVMGAAVSLTSGQREKDLVGGVVEDAPVEAHEHAAELFTQAAAAGWSSRSAWPS